MEPVAFTPPELASYEKLMEEIREDETDEEGTVVYHLHVAESDMGRVIGKQGRIAKAIRTVMRAASVKNGGKVAVEID